MKHVQWQKVMDRANDAHPGPAGRGEIVVHPAQVDLFETEPEPTQGVLWTQGDKTNLMFEVK